MTARKTKTEDDDVTEQSAPSRTPAAASSPLAGLRQRRAEAVQRSKLDLAVPGYEPPVYVRFRALDPDELGRISERHSKGKAVERPLRVNCALLATACEGIFQVDPETGDEVSVDPSDLHGDWPRFDARLGELLGETTENASEAVLAFYVEKMHILSAGDELANWSTGRDSELRRSEQGE